MANTGKALRTVFRDNTGDQDAYGSESITNQGFWLGFTEMFASYQWFSEYLDNLAAVTPEDVQRVAQTYLRPQNRVLGTYLPASKEVAP